MLVNFDFPNAGLSEDRHHGVRKIVNIHVPVCGLLELLTGIHVLVYSCSALNWLSYTNFISPVSFLVQSNMTLFTFMVSISQISFLIF